MTEKEEKKINDRLNKLEETLNYTNCLLQELVENKKNLQTQTINSEQTDPHQKSPTIAIKSSSKIDFVPIKEIVYCCTNLSYTEIILSNKKILTTKKLNDIEIQLNSSDFIRINKSALINKKFITCFDKKENTVVLDNKYELEVSRRKKPALIESINSLFI